MAAVIYKNCADLPFKKVLKILRNPDLNRVSPVPPTADIEPNSVYVYHVGEYETTKFWRGDGRHWEHLRSSKYPKQQPKITKRDCQRLGAGGRKEFFRFEYEAFGSKINPPNLWKSPYVVVHYKGSTVDGKKPKDDPPHGNSKCPPQTIEATRERARQGLPLPNETPVRYVGQGGLSYVPAKQTARKSTAYPQKRKYDDLDAALDEYFKNQSGNDDGTGSFGGEQTDGCDQFSQDTVVLPGSAKRPKVSRTLDFTSKPGPEKMADQNIGNHNSSTELGPLQCDDDMSYDNDNNATQVHGNDYRPPHVPTNPRVRQDISSKFKSGQNSKQIYREMQRESFQKHGTNEPSLTPRNLKQVQNEQQRLARVLRQHDDVYEVCLLAKQHPDTILHVGFIPLIIIQIHPELAKHTSTFQDGFTGKPTVFHYDTTFDMGDFYTSILSVRHPLFKREPLIPVAMMMHESADEKAHTVFFQTMKEKFSINRKNTVIVTDREKGIRNAIEAQLEQVQNIFCWNHLRKNVEEWGRRHKIPTEDVRRYKKNVWDLLLSATAQDYNNLMESLLPTWGNGFQSYYSNNLDDDIKKSYRPVLQPLKIYLILSGMTNNPAESMNASFKSITNNEKSGFYQLCLAFMLYQNDFVVDILRGYEKQGNFLINFPAVPKRLYKPVASNDVVDPSVISALVYKGKIPPNLATSKPYPFPANAEETAKKGLSELFIAYDRVHLSPKLQIFNVNGLDGTKYLVDLGKNHCSCLSQTLCEHMLAVLKSTGIPLPKNLKKRKPDLGKLYRATRNNLAGKKRGLGQRPRIAHQFIKATLNTESEASSDEADSVPDQTGTTAKSNSDAVASSPKVDEIKAETESAKTKQERKQKDNVILLRKLADNQKPPRITKANISRGVLKLPSGTIDLGDLKSIDASPTNLELKLLREKYGPDFTKENADWMVDSTISGFLFKISDFEGNGTVSLTASETLNIMSGANPSCLHSSTVEKSEHRWKSIDRILMPFNENGCHWILISIMPKEKSIEVLDPVRAFKLKPKMRQQIFQMVTAKFGNSLPNGDWKVNYPNTALSSGTNSSQCGPFVCYYAEALVRGWSLRRVPEISSYRNHIMATLFGGCNLRKNIATKKCAYCNQLVSSPDKCNFCEKVAHHSCMQTISVNDNEYFICPEDKQR